MNTVTAKEIGSALGVTPRAVRKRAMREGWDSQPVSNPSGGGVVIHYKVEKLPEPVRFAMLASTPQAVLVEPANTLPIKRAPKRAVTPALAVAQQANAMAKADLLRLYLQHVDRAKRGRKTTARDEFCLAYNSGISYPTLFEKLGPVNWKTIEGWKARVKRKNDTLALADGRGYWKRGQTTIPAEQASLIIRCALSPNAPLISEAIRTARAIMAVKGLPDLHSEATYRRYISEWASRNYHWWVFCREGVKAWNDKCAMYIERDYDAIDVGDILVADGHVLNFEILNPWTGKPKRMTLILWYDMKSNFPCGWEIMPTENTQAISAALRRAILQLGKMPRVAYLDNGRAFKSRFFQGCDDFEQAGFAGLYKDLGIKTIFAWPYHGQSKTVERFFGTMGELERKALTYVGTSIDKKPPRMMRGEKLHRKVWDKIAGGEPVTLEQAHLAMADWFDEYTHREQKSGHLKGQRPVDVFLDGRGPGIENPADLHLLMMAQEIRQIRRNGVFFHGQHYNAPELHGWRRPVLIRYDLADPSYILVYDLEDTAGQPICVATPPPKVHPAAYALGDEADQALLKEQIHLKKSQEKQASGICRALLEAEILPAVRESAARLGMDPARIAANQPPQLPEPEDLTEADEARIMAEFAELEAANRPQDYWADMDAITDRDRYERIIEARVLTMLIPKKWQAFARYYEETDEYQRQAEYFENFQVQKIWEHQTQDAQNI